jgi:hypothetical protein
MVDEFTYSGAVGSGSYLYASINLSDRSMS